MNDLVIVGILVGAVAFTLFYFMQFAKSPKQMFRETYLHNYEKLALLTNQKNKIILDVGCGNRKLPWAIGIDLSDKADIKQDLEKKWAVEDGSIDMVFSNQVIEHITEPDFFVKEIKRVLKNGGTAIISTENLSSWHNIFALFMGWQAFSQNISREKRIGNPLSANSEENCLQDKEKYGYPLHKHIFTAYGLRNLFRLHGFTIEETFGWGYYPFPAWFGSIDKTHSAFIGVRVRK